MPRITRRSVILTLASLALLAGRSAAAPTRYRLDAQASHVGFQFVLNGVAQSGTMPVRAAEIMIDPANLAASRVDVSVDIASAHTGLIFATRALVGAEMLDAARFPTIRFTSDKVQLASDGRLSGGARIAGQTAQVDLKDCASQGRDDFVRFGQGVVDFPAALNQLSGTDFEGWLVIELPLITQASAIDDLRAGAALARRFVEDPA